MKRMVTVGVVGASGHAGGELCRLLLGHPNVAEIILEVAAARVTERGGRADDKRSEAALEDRKRAGYF